MEKTSPALPFVILCRTASGLGFGQGPGPSHLQLSYPRFSSGRGAGIWPGVPGRRRCPPTSVTREGSSCPASRTLSRGASSRPRAGELWTRNPGSPAFTVAFSTGLLRCLNPGLRRSGFGRKSDFGKRKGEGVSPPLSPKSTSGSFRQSSC